MPGLEPRREPALARDPLFGSFDKHWDELVERMLRRQTPATYQRAWAPRVDVYEGPDEFVAVVELAGVDSANVTIEIESEEVTISGQRAPSPAPPDTEPVQIEIPFGMFERRLFLPCAVDTSRASAAFDDGMLRITLPKSRQSPARVQIDIQRPE